MPDITTEVWFNGLGSAIIGGLVAFGVAYFTVRTTSRHDRKMQEQHRRRDIASRVKATALGLASTASWDTGFNQETSHAYMRWIDECMTVVTEGDEALNNWLEGACAHVTSALDPRKSHSSADNQQLAELLARITGILLVRLVIDPSRALPNLDKWTTKSTDEKGEPAQPAPTTPD